MTVTGEFVAGGQTRRTSANNEGPIQRLRQVLFTAPVLDVGVDEVSIGTLELTNIRRSS
jgi:hypothetical protein